MNLRRVMPGQELTDAEVIAESLTDGAVFGVVFDRHFATIHRYLARRAGSEADDLAAETFTIAFARRRDYQLDRASALPWLYGIASNLLRAGQRQRLHGLSLVQRLAVPADAEAFESGVDDRIDAERAVANVRRLLDGLAEDDLATLLLYAWEDLSYREIAEALGVPVGTVRSRLHRVRRQLREPLSP